MSLRKWALIFGFAWVGLATIDTDEADKTQEKHTASSTNPASRVKLESIEPMAASRADPKPKKSKTLFVTGSVVNVRSGPSTAYKKLFQLRKGQAVKELETRDGWIKLSFDNHSGWMSVQFLSPSPPSTEAGTATKTSPQCHPNYSGGCVPIASDVDCAGGSGNGPAYVQGPVQVIGRDVYRLDRDKDGIGCE